MIGESILELHETNDTDESIKSYEYDEYLPITGTQLNNAGQITITIENQGQFLHLHISYLLIEGDVYKAAGNDARYTDDDLFSCLKLTLAGQEVGHFNYPAQATSLLGLVSYSSDYHKGCGMVHGWYPDTNNAAALTNT